jgi:type I restriction enzyme R subunit
VANQLTVIENGVNKRPDVVLFVNGLPLVWGVNVFVTLLFQ